jgi:hypothetical protein
MNTSRAVGFALILAVSGTGCSGDSGGSLRPDDYIVFGDFYGECLGESCVDIFKVAKGQVLEDTLDHYPIASRLPHQVAFVQISRDRYQEIVDLIGNIPARLFDEKDTVIGQPDAGDWGGFYLETNISGAVRCWLIDKMDDNLPEYLRGYARKLDEAILIAGE